MESLISQLEAAIDEPNLEKALNLDRKLLDEIKDWKPVIHGSYLKLGSLKAVVV